MFNFALLYVPLEPVQHAFELTKPEPKPKPKKAQSPSPGNQRYGSRGFLARPQRSNARRIRTGQEPDSRTKRGRQTARKESPAGENGNRTMPKLPQSSYSRPDQVRGVPRQAQQEQVALELQEERARTRNSVQRTPNPIYRPWGYFPRPVLMADTRSVTDRLSPVALATGRSGVSAPPICSRGSFHAVSPSIIHA